MTGSPVVFLDRDGTIIFDRNYLGDPEGVAMLPHSIDGLRCMQDVGCMLVVVSNQSGVGRGFISMDQVNRVNDRMVQLLQNEGISLGGIYVCPHRHDEGCNCRKPKPGLVLMAAADLGIEIDNCFVIGDRNSDVELGNHISAKTIYINNRCHQLSSMSDCDFVANDLLEAALWIKSVL